MIKLKIGDNYLITTYDDKNFNMFIPYMMGCFQGHNKTAIGFVPEQQSSKILENYIKAIEEMKPAELIILSYHAEKRIMREKKLKGLATSKYKLSLRTFITNIKEVSPNTNIKIVKVEDSFYSKQFKVADKLYQALLQDDTSILSKLRYLDNYKEFNTRYKRIPAEIKVINDSIKQMSKKTVVSTKKTTLKDLEYLNLIDGAELDGNNLILTIKPLKLYPSEKLGDVYTESEFKNNPYLYKVASYIYQGCTFGMVGTRISIDSRFTPRFLETLDHSFDDMFKKSNWSSVGYLHFGQGHLCGGEFNNVIAHAAEHGLEYYFLCLKQYITTGNVRDYAGQKIWWYPIYNEAGELVYCAGLDILRDRLIEKDPKLKDIIGDMSWNEFLDWKKEKGINFCDYSFVHESSNTHTTSPSKGIDRFLAVCKEKDPELYKQLEKGNR